MPWPDAVPPGGALTIGSCPCPLNTAPRTLVGLFRGGSGVWLYEKRGLCVRRSREALEWGLGAAELSEHLEALDVPYTVAAETITIGGERKVGLSVQVSRKDLGSMSRFVPSFQRRIDAAETAWTVPAAGLPTAESGE